MNFDQLQVILAHHWLVSMRGGEKTLEAIAELCPQAPIYSLAGMPNKLSDALRRHPLHFSFIQNLPGSPRYFRSYLPFFALAIRRMRVPKCNLLISSDANLIKGISKPPGALHLCYCHSPARYIWGMEDIYLRSVAKTLRPLVRHFLTQLRDSDREFAKDVDFFIANSRCVADRISLYYGRTVDAIISPPVNTVQLRASVQRESFYLVVSELTPYKRIDLAVEACTHLKKPLIVIGTGSEMKRLQAMAGPQVVFMGWQDDRTVHSFMSRAKAFLFPGEEDFGITPVEANACGAPVIAYGKGGIRDTMIEGRTSVFFHEQNLESIIQAIETFERDLKNFDITEMKIQASRFSKEEFQKKFRHFILNKLNLVD